MVSGKLPPEKFPPIKLPPSKSPRIIPTQKIPSCNISTNVFKYSQPSSLIIFFHYHHRYHWYYLKACFVIQCFKSTEVRLVAVYQKNFNSVRCPVFYYYYHSVIFTFYISLLALLSLPTLILSSFLSLLFIITIY